MQASPAVCRVHSAAHAPISASDDLMDDFDRASANSAPRRMPPRSVLTVKHSHGLQAPSGQALETTKEGPEQLQQLLDHLQHLAGSSANSSSVDGSPVAAGQDKSAREVLLAACNQQDRWRLLQCGKWEKHTEGWSGPARALIQVWPMSPATAVADKVLLGYDLWEIGPDWSPTGMQFGSGTGEAQDTIIVTRADLQQTHPLR
jgi:hypothetical protein